MSTCIRALVLLSRVVVKVDSLVVDQVESSIILLVFAVLASLVILGSNRCLVVVRAILKITILHPLAVNMVSIIFQKVLNIEF